ncbi:hypothetical protein POJ06DRAFT_266335 [Lipomyces tetrasporus]|uniref:Uncharacterized protein n=1 Tax=Lipomyces tetrasporus TaxID=54092 RepID=A0AAD7VTQ9_9ASCO|nr:uncharacterized protein POJ06DRAFT_266335 [Lipomyces tetrasporus]KAJ8101723.1 hypothetical protein POJ06DRAFT_266335 [Lipomyces tetrasporus]
MSSRPSNYPGTGATGSVPVNPAAVPSEPPPPYSLEADDRNSYAMNQQQQGVVPPPLPQNTRPQQGQKPQNQWMQAAHPPQQNNALPVPPHPQQYRYNYTPAADGKLLYPPGYLCEKCGNTGYKYSNGHPCRRCFERFAAPQSRNVHTLAPTVGSQWYYPYTPSYVGPVGAPGRVVPPGDPSIGGVLCGACKGRGVVDDFGLGRTIGEMLGGMSTCSVCKGVGRLL